MQLMVKNLIGFNTTLRTLSNTCCDHQSEKEITGASCSEQVVRHIRDNGPISSRDFMEMCLYDEELGYYTAKESIVGKDGDFYTSCTVSPIFGIVMAKQLEEMWILMGKPQFTIVEYGAGTGALAKAILDQLSKNEEMYAELRYFIIEKSPLMRQKEKELLPDKVEWIDSIQEIAGFQGCVLSNELLDNFAVHRVVMQSDLMEVFVNFEDGFAEELRPANTALKEYLIELGVELPLGYHTEINLQALEWLSDIAIAMRRGYLLTIDYGYTNLEMYKPSRSQGTMLCYHRHKVNDSIYAHIGAQDITCHVNFSALSHWGAKNGLNECGFTSQSNFLMALGFRNELFKMLSAEKDVMQAAVKATAISNTLLMDMGSKFKVLIQEKGMQQEKLSSLAYCSSAAL
jgi:SAM-dependent MidA family methyltransferase